METWKNDSAIIPVALSRNNFLKPQPEHRCKVEVSALGDWPQFPSIAATREQVTIKGNLGGKGQGCALKDFLPECNNRGEGQIA